MALKIQKLQDENERTNKRSEIALRQMSSELDSTRNILTRTTEQLHTLETTNEDLRLQIDQLSKANSFYKSSLSQEGVNKSVRQHNTLLLKQAQQILAATKALREQIYTAKRELKDEFFHVKIQKNLEIFKMKMTEEFQRRKFLEQSVQRYKKELSFTNKTAESSLSSMVTPISTNLRSLETEMDSKTFQSRMSTKSPAKRVTSLSELSINLLPPKLHLMSLSSATRTSDTNKENVSVVNLVNTPIKKGDLTGIRETDKTVGKSKPELDDKLDLKAIELETLEITKRIERLRGGISNVTTNPVISNDMGILNSQRSFPDSQRGETSKQRFFYDESASK